MTLFVLAVGILGLIFGSFANVCVHRIPRRESIAFPASHCPACKHPIAFRDNVPLVSWILLKGRCRHCHEPISWRYPLLEAIMGLSFAGLAWLYGPTPILLMALSLFFLLWILTLIDLETWLLPNALTFPGIALGLAFSWWFGYLQEALIGAVAGYWIFWLVARIFLLVTGREGMGYGDFKLLAMLGAFMGWQALPFIILASSVAGVVVGSIFLLLSRRGMRAEIPFGPYLAVAGMLWFVAGGEIVAWYTGLLGVSG
ncbi:type 4 prepilin peptidase 1 Aspartic peptidase, MEROPS family A24A [Mariprofundus ferrinatatus]|uniref:Prepilin leader peptidase/N-methyltransferase n=1 Tax=Mariprofundus ferrinatatus TaxID=1921087 RepID=A0A2K8L5P4_9PROT|nr:A24 family peptidase [Mariprofundus ferrinatatus]ATX82638.1 type 4 prepilin peptidase 1 Aspartic peptidase, MEROPS family A24A [Mariprofundus ferrinatatus]